MSDGKIVFSTRIDNSQVEKDLKNIQKKIKQSEEVISKAEASKLPLTKQAEELGVALDAAKAKAESLKATQKSISAAMQPGVDPSAYIDSASQKSSVDAAVKAQDKQVAALQKQWDRVNGKIDSYDTKIKDATSSIVASKEQAGQLQAQLSRGGVDMSAALDKAAKSADHFKKRLSRIISSALVFSLVYQALHKVVQYMSTALKQNEAFRAELARVQGALLTAFQPLYEFVLPAAISVLRVITAIVSVVANVLSALGGKTVKQSANGAKALRNQASAYKEVGGAAKEAAKEIASFDQITKVGMDDTGGGGGGGIPDDLEPNFEEFDTEEYKAKIDELTVYLSGVPLALGAILAFSGANIPLGIGLMAAGAVSLAAIAKENWDAMSEPLRSALTNVLGVVGTAFLVIGAVLAFSGVSIGKGIALMALGVAEITGAVAVNWDTISEFIKKSAGKIRVVLSIALLAVGAVLAFSGANLPLGIGLMAVGAAGLANAIAINWDTITSMIQGKIGFLIGLLSAELLALGAILLFTAANIPLGLGLIAVGALGLAASVSANWDYLTGMLQGRIGIITGILGGALIVIGIILLCTGVGIPLGLGLLLAGAAGLAATVAANWDFITEKLTGIWEGVKAYWNSNIAPIFTVAWWKATFLSIKDGLEEAVTSGINKAIELFNKFIGWINGKMNFSWNAKYILGKQIIPAGSMQLFSIPEIPYLAKGGVIPPNAPFMAMLGDQKHGTNIEAPLETIQEAVAVVMDDQTAAILAGFEASVGVQREILEAILGISIGDDVIGNAMARYQQKQAIITGGTL